MGCTDNISIDGCFSEAQINWASLSLFAKSGKPTYCDIKGQWHLVAH